MLSIVGKFTYTKYWGILYDEHCGKIIYTKYLGILYVEHSGKIYLHKILRNTSCWTLWEYLFTYNSWKYVVLNTEIYLYKILGNTLCWALWEYLFTQNTGNYFMLNTVGRCIYTKYRGILYVEHYGKIYLKKNLGITLCWTLWEDLFTQNTGDYFMLNTVGRLFIQNIW
jgi:hypothetical protein